MTESIRGAAKRQDGEDPARSEVVREPAPETAHSAHSAHSALPVAGLAVPEPLSFQPLSFQPLSLQPLSLGRSAGPVSVVDALRRQAIRRSRRGAVMDLGSDESEMDEAEDEAPSWEGTAEEAGKNLVKWLRAKAGDRTNYTVAVCNDDIYITKVNGVTAKTALIKQLKTHIESEGIENGRDIYLCQKHNTSQPSNHAEMCVLAAIGEGSLGSITFFECTSPSCDYCDAALKHYGVVNTSPKGEPASQMGWTHPFLPVVFGTQLGDHGTQVAELKKYLKDPKTKLTIGRATTSEPAGRCEKWL